MYTEKEMLEFSDWCRNGLTNIEYSDLHSKNELLKEWKKRSVIIYLENN